MYMYKDTVTSLCAYLYKQTPFSLFLHTHRHVHTVLFAVSKFWVMQFRVFWLLAQTVVSGSLWIFDKKPTRVSSPCPLSSHPSIRSFLSRRSSDTISGLDTNEGRCWGTLLACLIQPLKNQQLPICSASHLGHTVPGILIHITHFSPPLDFWAF